MSGLKESRQESAHGSSLVELARLREEFWRLRGRRSRTTGTILFIFGGVLFALAFLTRFIVFEVSAILSLLVGAVLMSTSAEPYVKRRVANNVGISSFKALAELLTAKTSGANPIFEYDKQSSSISVTLAENSSEGSEATLGPPVKGQTIPSSGEALLEDIRRELNGSDTLQLEQMLDSLPRTLVYGVGLAEKIEVEQRSESIEVRLWGMSFRDFCMNEDVRLLCGRVGCPVNGSIASLLALSSRKSILAKGCTFNGRGQLTVLRYRILEHEDAESEQNSQT